MAFKTDRLSEQIINFPLIDAAYSVAASIPYASAVKMEQKLKISPLLIILTQSSVAAKDVQLADFDPSVKRNFQEVALYSSSICRNSIWVANLLKEFLLTIRN